MQQIRFVIIAFVGILVGLAVFAQNGSENEAPLAITVAGETCQLGMMVEDACEATPEPDATEESEDVPEPVTTQEPEQESDEAPEATQQPDEPEYPVITLGEDCDDVLQTLHVPNNGTLWIALSVPEEEDWQTLETLEDDDFPPQMDRRGRFIGCSSREQGEQVCSVLWESDGVVYLVEIPFVVGQAFVAPSSNNTSDDTSQDTSDSSGEWGACGSCSACGADSSVCVVSPAGMCVADPGRCAAPPVTNSSSGRSGSPSPATTEEP